MRSIVNFIDLWYHSMFVSIVIVIGGGVGGFSVAIRLVCVGLLVMLFEWVSKLGGSLREFEVGGRTFGAGPRVLMIPHIFKKLFNNLSNKYIPLFPYDPLYRHFFPNNSQLDLFTDKKHNPKTITRFTKQHKTN